MKYIESNEIAAENLDFDIKEVANILYQDIAILMEWSSLQDEEFFLDLSLQEILNLYRISASYEDFETWLNESPLEAVDGYNRAVEEDNRMVVN